MPPPSKKLSNERSSHVSQPSNGSVQPTQAALPQDRSRELNEQETVDPIVEQATSNNTPPATTTTDNDGDPNCPICRIDVVDDEENGGIMCELCNTWSHRVCLFMSEETFQQLKDSPDPWYCASCLSILSNKIEWGSMKGEAVIRAKITSIYEEITKWRKNLFLLPRGKVGTNFIKEIIRLIQLFIIPSNWSRLGLSMVFIFIPLMLQKPSSKSKARDHTKYLEKRLKYWSDGDLDSILSENREIQRKLKISQDRKQESKFKSFCRLMVAGKISQAAKFIDSDNDTRGVHPLSPVIKTLLEEKHPKEKEVCNDVLLPLSANDPEPVIYEEIDGTAVYKAAKQIQGSGGPTLIDADGWRHILCSKSYGTASNELCETIADLAKKLCREDINSDTLHEFIANRLIPLDKGEDKEGNPGVRPIGVGEILRRIIGKVVVGNIREDIINAAGPLQTCAGLKSGIEASIHAMRKIFQEDQTEGILLVDAENAFNNLNRKAALHNIKELCPPFFRYLSNTYKIPAKMIVNDSVKTESILSEEGTTQGDVAAMGMYAVGIRPLINILQETTDTTKCQQVWYADDSTAGGQLREIRKWWDILFVAGPKFGYIPKPSKTVLIVKPEHFDFATQLFSDTEIKITKAGERHLGAVIGSNQFREQYITNKISQWIKDVEQLAEFAVDEPQLAYSAYTKAVSMRWGFLQRTIPNTKQYFLPLETTIRDKLIPAIIGRTVSDLERNIMSLPVRLGGMGIQNPTYTADIEFRNSSIVTRNLTELIIRQETNLTSYNGDRMKLELQKLKAEKEEAMIAQMEELKNQADPKLRRSIELAAEKGAGAWLSALPLQAYGYTLNKQEFRDSVCLRYGWRIPNTPAYCGCSKKNSVDHTLNCHLGGFVAMRHNNIRDFEAKLLKEVCRDVKVEPELLPIGAETLSRNTADKARLDVSAVGIWSPMERTFLDVRVMHPNSASYIDKSPDQIYLQHEREKKRKYNDRVLQVEKGSFSPLIFSTTGGMGPESTRYHKKVAELIAVKRGESYPDVMNYIRTSICFSLLKSVLIAVRGERGKRRRVAAAPLSDLSLNLIPERTTYEV